MKRLAVALILGALALTACQPHEVAAFRALSPEGQRAVVDALSATHNHPFLVCVRAHESDTAGGYSAQNPTSSASGAYQFIDGTWRNVAPRAGHPGYSRAIYAPWWVQDAVALWTLNNIGSSPWAGTGC